MILGAIIVGPMAGMIWAVALAIVGMGFVVAVGSACWSANFWRQQVEQYDTGIRSRPEWPS